MPSQGRNRGQITATGNKALVAGNVALGAGWGADATVELTSGANDVAGQLVVSALVGGGAMAQATATVTITFATPYSAAPRAVLISTTNTNSLDTGHATYTVSTTSLVITFSLLPVTAKAYTFNYAVIA